MCADDTIRSLREILCSFTPAWPLQSKFLRRCQEPLEGVPEFHLSLRFLGRKACPDLSASAVEQILLEQLIDNISDPEVLKVRLRQQPSKLDVAFRLARQEKSLQAACANQLRGCAGVASVQPYITLGVGT
ncbi:hypothetical protein AAHC03_0805 [Spirometra sp. Aus1]